MRPGRMLAALAGFLSFGALLALLSSPELPAALIAVLSGALYYVAGCND